MPSQLDRARELIASILRPALPGDWDSAVSGTDEDMRFLIHGDYATLEAIARAVAFHNVAVAEAARGFWVQPGMQRAVIPNEGEHTRKVGPQ